MKCTDCQPVFEPFDMSREGPVFSHIQLCALHAAAPELLEACKRLLKFNKELCEDNNVSKHYPSATFAREVIAKAEPQS